MISPEVVTPDRQSKPRLPVSAWIAIALVLCLVAGMIAYAVSSGLAHRVQEIGRAHV